MGSIFNFVVIATLLVAVFLLAECSVEGGVLEAGGRSARWDAYRDSKRQRRDTPTMEWQSKKQFRTCTLSDITTYDALGRRASGLLATPQDQVSCGSCWAFTATHVFTDYLSLQRNRKVAVFSADYLTQCIAPFRGGEHSQDLGNGCCGGSSHSAFSFLKEVGTVSDSCRPYSLGRYSTSNINKIFYPLVCPRYCVNYEDFMPASNRITTGFAELRNEGEVITALDQGRPVYAHMEVRDDFGDYRCGVYFDDPVQEPNHAVEIIDYSSDDPYYQGSPYWVVKNSWGTTFGEGGYFRMARGRNQLETFVTLSDYSQTSIPDATPDLTADTCNAQKPNDESDNVLIQSAAEFAIERLNNRSEIRCSDDDTAVATLTLSSITNGTVQVVEGFAVQAMVEVDVEGCREDTATITLTVMVDMDDNFSLVESSNYAVIEPTSSADVNSANLALNMLVTATMLAIFA